MRQTAVLLLSGLDPSGAAGISADIETLAYHHVVPLPIITALTAQNTQCVRTQKAVSVALIDEQTQMLSADVSYQAVKIGLLASAAQIKWLGKFAQTQTCPIVLDPIIRASSGAVFLNADKLHLLKQYVLPFVTLLTPNIAELTALTRVNDTDQAAKILSCSWLLATNGASQNIEHRLYENGIYRCSFYNPKLPHHYHGSGCTLASAAAAQLALGKAVDHACEQALNYTYQTLKSAIKLGKKQAHPKRFI